MVASLAGIPKNSNVYRFITSGKPGFCELCGKQVSKLEAHHVTYVPQSTISICHDCHHKVHFWPQRLNEKEKEKLLLKRFSKETTKRILKENFLGPLALAQLVAPSRKQHIQEHILKHNKIFESREKVKEQEKKDIISLRGRTHTKKFKKR